MRPDTSNQVEDGRPYRLSGARGRLVRLGWVALSGLVAATTALASGLPASSAAASTSVASHASTSPTYKLLSASSSSGNLGSMVTPASVTSLPAGALPPASAEVTSLRTRTSRTYLVDGGYEAVISGGSVNFQASTGAMEPINNSLVPSSVPGYAWQNQGNWYTLLLPKTLGAAPVEFRSSVGTISFQLAGAGGTASVSGASITYANALPGLSLTLTAENDSLKETLKLAGPQSPTSLTYSLSLSSGLQASATAAGGAVVTNSAGTTEFSFDPPTMVDAAGVAAPANDATLQLGTTAAGQTLTLSLNTSWLDSSTRQWPVTVDPSVLHYNADQDCQIDKGTGANTNYCGSGTLLTAGLGGLNNNVQRSVLQFNVQNVVPAGAQVTHASLELYLDSASTTSYDNVALYQLTQAWTTGVTWNDDNGSSAWTTAGGTYAATSLAAQEPTTAGWYTWGNSATTQLVQNWLTGATANDGLLIRAGTETDNELYTFDSTRGTNLPELNVFYVNALGQGSGSQQLTDRSGLSVNVANGNLVVTGNDVQIQGTGLSLSVERFYNSLGVGNAYQVGGFGTWLMGSGVDEHLTVVDNHVDFQAPGGADETFYSNGSGGFTPPPGANAKLVQNSNGSYTLTYDSSGEQLNFNSSGYLTSDVDRNGDTLTYTISGTNLGSITDTQGRTITFAYGSTVGSNLITSIADPTGRVWQYAYTSANGFAELTQYTDPNGKVTTYAYGTRGQLTMITDPLGNETTFGYNSQLQVTSITNVTNTSLGTGPTTTYAYYPEQTGSCAAAPAGDSVAGNTVATDPNGHATTSCYDPQGLVIQTIDPNSASSAASYTSDQAVAVTTNALSQSTTSTYNTNNDLTQVTEPAGGSGQTPATGSATYSTPSTVAGYQYLPSSVTDPEGDCTAYVYDAAGNVTDTYAGQTPPCAGDTGGVHTGTRYQGDPGVSCGAKTGETCEVISGNGGATTYGYDSNGRGTSITPPSPLGGETITYDALSRVSTVTDGNGSKTTYSYDNLDRVTQILYGGATTCTPSTGNCITYAFDSDGNRISMTDQSGTTNYYYNALHQMTTETLPDGTSACAGSSPSGTTYTYDGVGNLLTYCDSGGTTTYSYDPDNLLLSIAEPGGSCVSPVSLCTTFQYNAVGARTKITFPGGATQTTAYDNADDVLAVVGASSTGATLTSFMYTYTNGANDTPLVQTQTENDAVASNTYTYSYNAANDLTAAAVTSGGGTSYGYSYDGDGNVLTKTAGSATTTYAYNSADQLCWAYSGVSSNPCSSAPTGATTYSFDSDGNETGSSTGAAFSYNTKNQTTSMSYGSTTLSGLSYTDQGQGNRISAGSTSFDNSTSETAISTISGSSTYYLTTGQGTVLGERIGSAHNYFLTNALGSVVAVINGTGQTVSDRYGYDPYGNTTYASVTVPNPFGYAGGYTDSTGLIHFGARYYDPGTARWLQVDPASLGTSSPYDYANDNAVLETDTQGTYPGVSSVGASVEWSWGVFGWTFHVVHIWLHASQTVVTHAVAWWGFFGLIASIASSGAAVIPFGWAEAQLWQNDSDPSSEWWNFVVLMSGPWWLPWWWDPIAQPLAFWTNPY
jgi:RHS repeat-associated protein